MLTLYRRLLGLRARSGAIRVGTYTPLFTDKRVLSYVRRAGQEGVFVALNFADEPIEILAPQEGAIVLSTHPGRDEEPTSGRLALSAYEGAVVGFT
jgi:glycosidase